MTKTDEILERKIDRLDRFANYKNLNDNQITNKTGLAIGTLGKSRKPGKDITRKTAEIILDTFPDLDRNWFLTGEGDMLCELPKPAFRSFPLIDTTTAECGPTFGNLDAYVASELPQISLPDIPAGTEFFIKSNGWSMINHNHPELSIPPGSYVGLASIGGSVVRWGEVYAVATTDGIMIKRITKDPADADSVVCSSYNSDEFPQFSIHKNDIYSFARITCVIPVYLR